MQLKLKVTHSVTEFMGCYTLVEIGGVIDSQTGTVQTAYYEIGNEAERMEKFNELIAFGKGILEGWNIARNSLWSPSFVTRVEELKGE